MTLADVDKQVISNFFTTYGNVLAVYIHGSAVKGTMRDDSDIDIALLLAGGEKLEAGTLMHMHGELSFSLGRTVDIGILSSDDLIYANQVLTNGKRIFVRDEYCAQFMELTLLSMYVHFSEELQEVRDAYSV